MVRMPRARRTGMTVFMAGCSEGAWKKAKRCLRREAAPSAGERPTGMPRASRTSAEPHEEVTARLPCLATISFASAEAPAAAATRAAAVEMLKVPLASAPVPQVSINRVRSVSVSGMGVAAARMVSTKPAISAGAGPRVASEPRRAAISRSVASPRRMVWRSSAASARERVSRSSMIRLR